MAFLSKNSAPIIVRDVNLMGLGLLEMGLVSAGAGTEGTDWEPII